MRKIKIGILSAIISVFIFTLGGCKIYSFTGANIAADIKTVTVEIFENRAPNAPASYNQTLTDQLKLKLVSEASLKQVSTDGDVGFKGHIVSYGVVALAPTAQIQTGVNRLSITVHVDYINTKDEKDKWSKDFTRFAEFPATELLSSREGQLINEINKQFIDDIFNEAFAKW